MKASAERLLLHLFFLNQKPINFNISFEMSFFFNKYNEGLLFESDFKSSEKLKKKH